MSHPLRIVPDMANTLSNEKRAQIVGMICEGMSVWAAARLAEVSKNTVTKLILDMGTACSIYQDEAFRNLDSEFVEVDEIWAFVGCKAANVPAEAEDSEEIGSVWTFVALDADSKLVITFQVSGRGGDDAYDFLTDLAPRFKNRIQLSTDGHKSYENTVRLAFQQKGVHWGTVIKKFVGGNEEHRYSPGKCSGIKKARKSGQPDMQRVNTSYIERQNLSIRMGSRRYTRLTNAFSKKFENHAAATALHFGYYNLCKTHGTLTKKNGTPTTPAMASGVVDHPWSVLELVELLDRYEA